MTATEPLAPIYVSRRAAFLRLWTLGLSGAAVAAAEPLPATLLVGAHMPELTFRAASFIDSALLLAVLVGLGTIAAREVALFSLLAPLEPRGAARSEAGVHWVQAAIIVGAIAAGAQFAFDAWFWHVIPHSQMLLLRHAAQLSASSPLTRLLFQALSDELMLRWGLMSGLLWALALIYRQPAGRPSRKLVWAAILGVSLFYVLGQLPAILNVLSSDPAGILLVRSVAVSALAGIAYGWLYWKHGLEAAILAHMLAQSGFLAFQGLAPL